MRFVTYVVCVGTGADGKQHDLKKKRSRNKQQHRKPRYTSYSGYEFPGVQKFTDLWAVLGVQMLGETTSTVSENLSDSDKCIECGEGRCIVHETHQDEPTKNSTQCVKMENVSLCAPSTSSSNLTVSENLSDSDKCIECGEGRCIVHETHQDEPTKNSTQCVRMENISLHVSETNFSLVSDDEQSANSTTVVSGKHCQRSVNGDNSEQVHDSQNILSLGSVEEHTANSTTAVPECTTGFNACSLHPDNRTNVNDSPVQHNTSEVIMSTHMQENDIHLQPDVLLLREEQQNQAIIASNKASHKNECHLNSSVKINATNEMKSTRFKLCKYCKKLMAITQIFAEESSETLSLQCRGLTTPNILEFAECIKSTSHELSDISHHLLQCSNLIKKHFESVNGLTHKKV